MSEPQLKLQDRFFDAWVGVMLRHRIIVLVSVLLVTVALGAYASTLPLVAAVIDYIPPNTKGLAEWQAARERFGGDEVAMYALEGDDHFSEAGLARLKTISERIEAHPFVERVISLSTLQQIRADPNDPTSLLIDSFIRDGVTPDEVLAAVGRDRLMAKALFSEDRKLTFVMVQLVASRDDIAARPGMESEIDPRIPDSARSPRASPGSLLDMAKQRFCLELVDWFEKAGYPRSNVHATGFPVFIASIVSDAERNMKVLLPLTMLLMAVALFVLLRRFTDALIPLFCIGPAVIWATAIGGAVLGRLTIMTSLVPIMVLVVGISDVVHLVTQFRHELARGHPRTEAIHIAFRHVGAACALTSLTTFIGFGSMMMLPIPQSRELGIFAAFGVVMAFVLSFVLTPVILSWVRPVPAEAAKAHMNDFLAVGLVRLSRLIRPVAVPITVAGFVATAVVVALLFQVEIENTFAKKLAPDHPIRAAITLLEKHKIGTDQFEILVDAGSPDGIRDPAVINGMLQMKERLLKERLIVDVVSIADLIDELHIVMAGGETPSPRSTWTREQIAQYLLLFEVSGGEDLNALIDDTGRHARMTVRIGDLTAEDVNALSDTIDSVAKEVMPSHVTAFASGIGVVAARIAPGILSSSITGFATALALIALLMAVLFRSVKVGVLCLVPNILPVALSVVLVSLVLDLVDADTLAFIAVCIGIAVDDTIHFMARYRIERDKGSDRDRAVEDTIREAGHGIVRTSIILVAGFSVMITSDYQPIVTVGVLLPITLVAAVVLDLTLVPAMALLGLLEPASTKTSP